MIIIGIDPHEATHTATALNSATKTDLGSIRIDASILEYQRLIAWARTWPDRTWAIENAEGLGHHLAQWLLALGEVVVDVSTTATARVRELSRGGRRKNDRIDAAAAASVAAMQGDARPVRSETATDSLALLDECRVDLSHSRTRTVNQLHALLRELMAGGAPTSLTPVRAAAAIRGFRPQSEVDRIRVELARGLIADIRRFDDQLAANSKALTRLLDMHGTRLRQVDGVGPVLAARLLGRTGHAGRFRSVAAYANFTRHRARADCQRGLLPPPALTLRRPATQFRHPHGGDDSNPDARQCRPGVLRQEDRRRKIGAFRVAVPQAAPCRLPLASHARRRESFRPNGFETGHK